MSNHSTPLRPAMTALAAVIALSSTPLLAQATDTTQAAPVVIAPPAPDVSAPSAVAQTATPDAAPVTAAPVEAAPAMRTMSTPVEHTVAEPADTAPTRSAPVTRTVTHNAAATAPPVAAKAAPIEAQRAIAPAPVQAPAPVAAAPAPITAPTPVATATQSTRQQSIESEALPIAGIVGLGVIAIGGAAFALRRKRREDDEEELLLEQEALVAPAPVVEAAPIAVAARAAPARAKGAKTLPNGFDISRFGRHTQAAYMGPTKDNPSLSLKRRLKRASFFDQREREAAEAGATTRKLAEPVYPAAAKAEKDKDQLTIRMTPQRKTSRNGYVLQK